jgi:hypothetical protein
MEKSNRTKICFIGIGLIIILLLIADFYAKRGLFGCFSPKLQIQKMALKYEVHRETKRYLDRNQRLLADLEKKIARAGSSNFEQACKNIPAVTRQFSSVTWNGKLCCKMAKDRLCRSSDTQAALNEVLQPRIIRHCENGNLAVRNELENFLLKLAENENRFHANLAQITGESKFFEGKDLARQQFLMDCHEFSERVRNDAVSRSLTILSAGLELIFLRSTIQLVTRVLGHITAKLASAGTTAGICAAADGPLPIGDTIGAVICIGGLAWCAYDLYDISKVMPKRVRSSLEKMVADYQVNCRKQALDIARKTVAEYQTAAGNMVKSL